MLVCVAEEKRRIDHEQSLRQREEECVRAGEGQGFGFRNFYNSDV